MSSQEDINNGMNIEVRTVDAEIKKRIGQEIKDWRESERLTHQEFADKIGCSFSLIHRWESGHSVPGNKLIKARLLEVTGLDVDGRIKLYEKEERDELLNGQ